MMNDIEIELGRYYRDRKGRVHGPTQLFISGVDDDYKFEAGAEAYTERGRANVEKETEWDLVEEVSYEDYVRAAARADVAEILLMACRIRSQGATLETMGARGLLDFIRAGI